MSHFLCVSIVPIRERSVAFEDVAAKAREFGFRAEDAGSSPTGRFARGRRDERLVFFLTLGGYSGYLLDRGPRKYHLSAECLTFLSWAIKQYGGVAVVVHVARGFLDTDPIVPAGNQRISFDELEDLFPGLQPEVRYVCIAGEEAGRTER